MYRPPDSSNHLHENFEQLLSDRLTRISSENKETIMTGDFNINYSKRNDHPGLKQTISTNGFKQIIKAPTRITNESATLIDLILTTHPLNISTHKVIPTSLSDHDMVGCIRKLHNCKIKPKRIKCRNYVNYDLNLIRVELRNVNWNHVFKFTNPIDAWAQVKKILTEIIDRYAPFVTKKVKGKSCPWLTAEVKAEMNQRDRLLRKFRKTKCTYDWKSFTRKRNYVNNLIHRSKKTYYQKLLNENSLKPDLFWKAINQIYPTKTKEGFGSFFTVENEITNDKHRIAKGFCRFFSTVAETLKTKAFPLTNCCWTRPSKPNTEPQCKFIFKSVSVDEVRLYLSKLQRNKATGPDDLPPGYLKDIAFEIAPSLAFIINLSLKTGKIPNDLKIGKITPIYKSGPRSNFDNYRPISVLPIVSKIMEKCVHKQLMSYLEENKLLSTNQYGF